jgi:putative transcriptional regulator
MAAADGRGRSCSGRRGPAPPSLRRLLAERSGLHMSSASVSALLTRQPAQVKLETLAALCTALQCTPGGLIEVDTTPVTQASAGQGRAQGRPGTVTAAAVSRYPLGADCGAPVKFRDRDRCHVCHRKAALAALKRSCPRCGRVRHLRPAGICAICDLPPSRLAGRRRPSAAVNADSSAATRDMACATAVSSPTRTGPSITAPRWQPGYQ